MATATPVVTITGLAKRYGTVDALAGIDLEISRGEVFGLLGPNGAGKTTTIECIVGLRAPTAGTVRVLGFDPARDRAEITARVAVQPQSASLFETLTVVETLRLFASFHVRARKLDDLLQLVGLTGQRNVRSRNLSGGQTRRLLLGVALVGNPQILVLDEPGAGLDPAARQGLWSLIVQLREEGTTVILCTHQMEEASALCDRVAIMVAGRIEALDSPAELVRQTGSRSVVSFTVPADAELTAVLRLAGVDTITHRRVSDGIRVTAVTDDADRLLRTITFDREITARQIGVKTTSLEDIFLDVASRGAA